MGRAHPLTIGILVIAAAAVDVSTREPVDQARPTTCVLIQPVRASTPLVERGACSTRLSPSSTFKIPHALVALETGVVTSESVERWDGVRHQQQPEWNRDHTVISALRPSVLWFYQRIAPRIGAERMSAWLTRFEYGNRDVSGPITEYWINGRLRISPHEQVQFLRRLYNGDLPIAAAHVRAVRLGLEQQAGTVQNALGIHQMKGDWRRAALNAKTGATTVAGVRVSWLVGQLRSVKDEFVFAAATWGNPNAIDSLAGARLAVDAFISAGLLPKSQAMSPEQLLTHRR